MFSAVFSAAFRGRAAYIGPLMAKAALSRGAPWSLCKNGLLIDGAELIGPAGKVFEFRDSAAAEKWALSAAKVASSERSIAARVSAEVAAVYAAKKRENLAKIAGYVALAAARQSDTKKRAALLAESAYCLSKWD